MTVTLPRALFNTKHEARRYILEGYVYFGLIHLHLALVLAGVVPAATLPVLLPIWMARMMIGRHELIHLRTERRVDPFTGMWPVLAMITPLSIGYREYRKNHDLHHRYLLTENDPDLYQIRGSRLRGFWSCFTGPEQDLVRWVMEHGVDRSLAQGVLIRGAFFASVVLVCGPVFLWYWLPLRVTYGFALFLFSHLLHRRGEAYGTFAIELSPFAISVFVLLFSRTGWLAVCNHDVHHADTRIAALRLAEARKAVLERE